MLLVLVEIVWGGSLFAIAVGGILSLVSPTARRRLLSSGQDDLRRRADAGARVAD